jgi:hypothetical protein
MEAKVYPFFMFDPLTISFSLGKAGEIEMGKTTRSSKKRKRR